MNKEEYVSKYGEEAYKIMREQRNKYYSENREKELNRKRRYCEDKEKWRDVYERYYGTKKGKVAKIINSYRAADKDKGRGDCTLEPDWVMENILNSSCIYCGETDWRKLGCDRIDNTKSHTPDNIVCSCWDCNNKRRKEGFEKFLYKSWRKRFNS